LKRTTDAHDRPSREAIELELRSFCFKHDLSDVLADAGRPHPYRFRRRFSENPHPAGTPPEPRAGEDRAGWKLLGYDIGYPLGVPSSALTAKSEWVDYFSRYGFNVFTLKSVRSEARDELPFPNWIYLQNLDSPLPLGADPRAIIALGNTSTYLPRLTSYSTANSFGVPSADPAVWGAEITNIKNILRPNQLLIVSVMGTPEGKERQEFIDDFVEVARLAAAAHAPAIELNLSCPNKLDDSGDMMAPVCEDAELTADIVKAIHTLLGPSIPLVAKLGYLAEEQLANLLPGIVNYVRGISGINTLQVKVSDPATGRPAFVGCDRHGRKVVRESAGLSGVALRYFALDFVQSLNHLRHAHVGWDFDIIAMGGVMDAHDVRALMAAGADCVQTATAAATNPALPLELRDAGFTEDRTDVDEIRSAVVAENGSLRSVEEVAARLEIDERRATELFGSPYDLPRFVAELIWRRRTQSRTEDTASSSDDSDATPSYRFARAMNASLKGLRQRRMIDASVGVSEAANLLGISDSDVEDLIDDRELAAIGIGATARIPLWQLTTEVPACILPGAAHVALAFPGSPVALAGWMHTYNRDLGATPLDTLKQGEVEQVLAACGTIAAAGR